MYQFKKEEIELNEEEKEKAKFISDTVREKNQEWEKGRSQWGGLEKAAFENFKTDFYRHLCFRLNLDILATQGSMSLSNDSLKVVVVTVVSTLQIE